MASVSSKSQEDGANLGGCPVLNGFDPMDAAQAANPYPWLKKSHEEAPVFFMPQYDLWCVSRYDDILAILRDPATFSSANNLDYGTELPVSIAEELGDDFHHGITKSINTVDPPEHTRRRKLLQPGMTQSAVRKLEPFLRQVSEDLVDGFVADGHADIMSRFASPLVVSAITGALGIPVERTDDFRAYNNAVTAVTLTRGLPESELVENWRTVIDTDNYIRDFVASRREKPEDDLTSQILQAVDSEGSDDPLSDEEVLNEILTFVVGGSDTTAIVICHMLHLLLTHPETLEEVRADPDLIPKVAEETMRMLGSIFGILRYTTRDVEVSGVTIPKGAGVWITLKGGNRDAGKFPDPDRFDIHRENLSAHLGFGNGRHFCIGAPLARLEMRVSLETLLERLPGLRLAPTQGELDYIPTFIVPTVTTYEVEWDA